MYLLEAKKKAERDIALQKAREEKEARKKAKEKNSSAAREAQEALERAVCVCVVMHVVVMMM